MKKFEYDDSGYLSWLASHPDGYVLNVRADPDPDYVVLHRAGCWQISTPRPSAEAYTGNSYRKWCAGIVEELRSAAKREGRVDGSFSKRCGLCRP